MMMNVDDIAREIKKVDKSNKPVLIAIEGFGGSGKSTTARKLKGAVGRAYVVKTDDFIIKEKLTLVSPDMECYDLERLEKQVLASAHQGAAITYQILDWVTNKLGEPVQIPAVDYIIVEGITAYFPTIDKYYDYKIWIDAPIDVANQRGKKNDAGTENEQYWDLWSKNDLAYREKYQPEQRADFVIDNSLDT